MRASPALLAGFLAVATACGGGAQEWTTAQAQQRAEAIVLKLSDLPQSWRALTLSAGDEARAAKFRSAWPNRRGSPRPEKRHDPKLGDVTGTYSEAQITKDVTQAEDRFRLYVEGMSAAASKRCFQEAIGQGQILPGIPSADPHELGAADIRDLQLSPAPAVEEIRAWEIVIPVKVTSGPTRGVSASVFFHVVVLRNGNRVVYVQTSDVAAPADSRLRDRLVRAVAARMSSS